MGDDLPPQERDQRATLSAREELPHQGAVHSTATTPTWLWTMVAVIVLTSFIGGAIAGSIAGRINERSHGSQCEGKASWLLGAALEQRGNRVYLASVYAGGPAGSAGLQTNDRLLSIEGASITSVSQAVEFLCSHSAGDQINVIAEHNHFVDQYFITLGLASDFECLTVVPVIPVVTQLSPDTNSNQREEAHLGVVYRMLAPGDPSGLDQGAMLIIIRPGGAAEIAGLQPGDIVLKVGEVSLSQSYTLEMALEHFSAGQTVNLLVRRAVDGRDVSTWVTLGG